MVQTGNWDVVIGLEVHAQLQTHSKIFSTAPTAYGAEPNTQACALDLGMPGTLPVLNKRALEMAIKFGLAVQADITEESVFARKHYFYPDLPKGYQISQDEFPIVVGGHINYPSDSGETKRLNLVRAHLEEDAGKSIHEGFSGETGIDLNRAGIPLLEIVTEPELYSPEDAVAFLKTLHALVRDLDICDGNMQEGSFRCDANVSIKPKGSSTLGTRAEVKNINSFRFVERAIIYEIQRQIRVLESGGTIIQETRLFDASTNKTRSMREKEDASDYRYFPDPDLLPVLVTHSDIDAIRQTLPELPDARLARIQSEYGLSAYDAGVLTASRELCQYFEKTAKLSGAAKLASNWITGELAANLNQNNLDITDSPIQAEQLAGLIKRIADDTISGKIAKTIFEVMWKTDKDADSIIEEKGLKQITDASAIQAIIKEIVDANPDQAEKYRAGKDRLFGFFVGETMKKTQGKANPKQVNELLKSALDQK